MTSTWIRAFIPLSIIFSYLFGVKAGIRSNSFRLFYGFAMQQFYFKSIYNVEMGSEFICACRGDRCRYWKIKSVNGRT